jgi:4-amino-4-deoxy-L-arabinose transferase-like glycosyltransferase
VRIVHGAGLRDVHVVPEIVTEAVSASGLDPLLSRPLGGHSTGSRRPAHAVPSRRFIAIALALALVYAVAWAAGMASYHRAPPLDSAEQLVWSYAMEGGYWKHPPLPSWIMHALLQMFGASVAVPFFAAQLSVAIALLLLWRLGCEFMSPRLSLLAAAITALVGYYGWCADAYNHNSALLPFQAAVTLCFYLAVRRGDWRLWVLTGLFAGLAMLVKYVALLPLAGLLLYVLLDREARTARTARGLAMAAAVAAAVFAPHVLWLEEHAFLPLQYARSVAVPLASPAAWLANAGDFWLAQFGRVLPLAIVLGWMAWARKRGVVAPAAAAPRGDRLFLWVVGLTPLALVVAFGLATRTEIVPRWGHNAFLLAGWLALDALRWPERGAAKALRVCAGMHVALWIAATLVAPRVAEAIGWHGRSTLPGQELASVAHSTWQAETDRPLRLVISDIWLGGTLVAYNGSTLAVLVDGELSRTPWVTARDVQECGALVVQDRTDPLPPLAGVSHWLEAAPLHGEWILPWARSRGRGQAPTETTIAWGVILPQGNSCRL